MFTFHSDPLRKAGSLLACLALCAGSVTAVFPAHAETIVTTKGTAVPRTAKMTVRKRPSSADFAAWGADLQNRIEQAGLLSARGLYADKWTPNGANRSPAFMWGCGVQLSALAAAARVSPKVYLPRLRRYADALDAYWHVVNGIGGYDVLPVPKPPDRYYDDNQWIVLALCETYEITGEQKYLNRAEETMRFVLSGHDNLLGDGIYWHEQEKNSKNTCSNAPAAAGALRLYELTRKPEYFNAGLRLVTWTNTHLQDGDGLFWDNVKIADGRIEKTKWSYNSALMIRSNTLLYQLTRDLAFLTEAQRIARAAEAHWFDPQSGTIRDGAAFAHLFTESLLFLSAQDGDNGRVERVARALATLRERGRNSDGWYVEHWNDSWGDAKDRRQKRQGDDAENTHQSAPIKLIDQASAARAFWVMAKQTSDGQGSERTKPTPFAGRVYVGNRP